MLTFIDLFSGIGGFSLGLEMTGGFTCVGHVEIDPYCQRVLKKHWPGVKLIGDIYDVKGDEFGEVDVVVGGFPCQPFSHAGKRLGAKDNRYLWPQMFRVIKATRPTWVVCENVAGLVSMEQSDSIVVVESATAICKETEMVCETIRRDLADAGYDSVPVIVPACAVDAPHRRDRIWIIANNNKLDSYNGGYDSSKICGKQQKAAKLPRGEKYVADASSEQDNGIGRDNKRGRYAVGRNGQTTQQDNGTANNYGPDRCRKNVSDTNKPRFQKRQRKDTERPWTKSGAESIGDKWWEFEPNVGRVAHGIPSRVDRLKCLGNAVVPQVVAKIGRAIIYAHTHPEEWLAMLKPRPHIKESL